METEADGVVLAAADINALFGSTAAMSLSPTISTTTDLASTGNEVMAILAGRAMSHTPIGVSVTPSGRLERTLYEPAGPMPTTLSVNTGFERNLVWNLVATREGVQAALQGRPIAGAISQTGGHELAIPWSGDLVLAKSKDHLRSGPKLAAPTDQTSGASFALGISDHALAERAESEVSEVMPTRAFADEELDRLANQFVSQIARFGGKTEFVIDGLHRHQHHSEDSPRLVVPPAYRYVS